MKVHILFQPATSPTGGGNQFLRTLDNIFTLNMVRADCVADADVVLFNSHHFMLQVATEKRRFPKKIFVHRIDGPMRLYNARTDKRDYIVNTAAATISDGTIFQSEWSRSENYRLGLYKNTSDTVIYNAVDPDIFNKNQTHRHELVTKSKKGL
ncbi:MAG: hypothetical protein JRJ65_17035 [Deltaproteobacteria bacterium]|nr:hypothetical protein [Deltaproteobacteria bacterium]